MDILYNIFKTNGYPESLLKRLLYSTKAPTNNLNKDSDAKIIYHTLPNIPNLSNKLVNIFKLNKTKFAFKNMKIIGNFYSNLKNSIDNLSKSNLVYSLECKSCNKQYIGQTSQKLKLRITQHKSDIKCKPNSCALSKHVIENLHLVDFTNPKILAFENNLDKRLFLEMCYINKIENNLNFRKDIQNLSNIYSFLLR